MFSRSCSIQETLALSVLMYVKNEVTYLHTEITDCCVGSNPPASIKPGIESFDCLPSPEFSD